MATPDELSYTTYKYSGHRINVREEHHCTLLCYEFEQLLLACSWGLAYATIGSKLTPLLYAHVHRSNGDSGDNTVQIFSEHAVNSLCILATLYPMIVTSNIRYLFLLIK